MRMFRRRPTGTTGATAVEYALILAGSVFGLFAIVVGLKGAMANAIGNAPGTFSGHLPTHTDGSCK